MGWLTQYQKFEIVMALGLIYFGLIFRCRLEHWGWLFHRFSATDENEV